MNFNVSQLIQSVQNDTSLSSEDKEKVLNMLSHPDFLTKLKSGLLGAGLAFLLSKFLKMSPRAQLLMTIAGFGIGRLLVVASSKHQEKFVQFNDKMKLYEINQ